MGQFWHTYGNNVLSLIRQANHTLKETMKEDTGINQNENPNNSALSANASIKKVSNTTGSGSIVGSSQKRSQVSKREAMSQAAQDAQEANRVYAQTYLTVLKAGTEEFTDSLTQHLGDMRQNLLEVEDDDDFLAQLMSGGCGGSLPI